MKTRIVSILDGSPFSVYRADVDKKVDDDPSLRKALGESNVQQKIMKRQRKIEADSINLPQSGD